MAYRRDHLSNAIAVTFLLLPPGESKLSSACIGLYYILIIVSTLFGNFPVPLMGYGISPIIGYYAAMTWYAKVKMKQP
jgi:hypothetical protein